jgi:ferric hydroxamate/heme transport system ATP-binding protein
LAPATELALEFVNAQLTCLAFPLQDTKGHQAARHAVQLCPLEAGLGPFAHRPLAMFSGGEWQRFWIAMVLAQSPVILLLDEPTTYLAIGHQWETMEIPEHLNREHGVTILMALHDIQHAAWFSRWLVVIQEGLVVVRVTPAEVLKAELMADIFRVRARIYQ